MSKISSALGGPPRLLRWSRLIAIAMGLAIVAPTVGCDKKKEKSSKEDDDEDEKPRKKKGDDKDAKSGSPAKSGDAPKPEGSGPTAGLAPTAPTAPATGAVAPSNSKYPDLAKLLGDKSNWVPPPFSMLKEDMAPAEVAKTFPGADKTGEFGIVEVPVTGQPGVWRYQFLYLGQTKNELAFVEIQFEPKLVSDEFWKHLVDGLKAKYGDKFEAPSTRSHTWTGSDFRIVELSEETDYESDPPRSYFAISVML